MEKRCKLSYETILKNAFPTFRFLEFLGCNGPRENNETTNAIIDILGIDALLHLWDCRKPIKVQIRTDSRDNFIDYGHERSSITLGGWNNLAENQIPIDSVDIFLSGYEIKPTILAPFALVYWHRLIRRISREELKLLIDIKRDDNSGNGDPFGWIKFTKLLNSNILLSSDFTAFNQPKPKR